MPLPSRHRLRHWPMATLALFCLLIPLAAGAQETPAGRSTDDPIAVLRREIAALKDEYGARLTALEERLAALEAAREAGAPAAAIPVEPEAPAAQAPLAPPAAPDDELAALRAAAAEAAGQTAATGPGPEAGPAEPSSGGTTPAVPGGERNLNRLNPEVSITGDMVGFATNRGPEDFNARELELNFQSALDPFSLTKWTLSFSPEEGVDIEEAYVTYAGLRGGVSLTAGKFRQNFGLLNRWHLHALPQLDYPLAVQSYFGDEGLAQTGLSATWLLPHPWATANELNLELTDGESDAFGGESFERLVGLAHLKNYWDVNPSTYLELGLSGVVGGNGSGGDSRVWGTDFTVHWQPPGRALYREITWRTELFRSERDSPEGEEEIRGESWGGYSYLEGLLRQNLYAGLRYDRVEDPLDPEHLTWGLFPSLTWWQSEFVRLRGEYGYLKDALTGGSEKKFSLQLVWSAGPHKHEIY